MLSIIKQILFPYRPADDPLHLPERKKQAGGQRPQMAEELYLVPSSGQIMRKSEFEENGAVVFEMTETDRTSDYGGRPKSLTDEDMAELEKRGVRDLIKAAELKVMWAAGYTAAEACSQKRGKRGYGLRTIEEHWAAFNAAKAPTPVSK